MPSGAAMMQMSTPVIPQCLNPSFTSPRIGSTSGSSTVGRQRSQFLNGSRQSALSVEHGSNNGDDAKEHGEPAKTSGKQELYETIVALYCK